MSSHWPKPGEHGNCPHCGESLNGSLIWEFFHAHTLDEAEADTLAAASGATRSQGWWNVAELVRDLSDGLGRWRCPECEGEWDQYVTPRNLHTLAADFRRD